MVATQNYADAVRTAVEAGVDAIVSGAGLPLELPGLDDCATVEYMDSFDDCLAALHSGEIDAYYTYTYQAERTVFDDKKNELRSMLSDERRSFCIGVNRDYDVLLRSVLNKSVNSLTRAEVVSITNKYINLGTQKFSLVRLAYQYPPVIVLTYLCVVAAIVCIRLVLRSRRFRAEAEKALHKAVHNMYERAVRKQAARQEELAASGKSEKLRLYGELLSANLYMAQKGMKSITAPNWYDEGKEVTIPLDLRFSPSQNAQNFFKNYKKKQTAARMLVDLLAEGEKEIAYLETVLYEVETAAGEAALNEIRAELKSQGYLKYYKQRDKRQKPADFLRFTSSDGFEILVGRNNAQNDKLTLHTARGKDLWFHVQKAPGSHVVVMSRGEDIPDTTRQEAAELAVIYSSAYKAGTGAKVAVDTTEVKNIWKANGAKPGMVLYEVYTTVYVTPREKLLDELKANAKK